MPPANAEQLHRAAAADGLTLRGDAMSLGELDGLLSAWRHDGVDRPWLNSEVGAYLAAVLAADVPGALVEPDGRVRLPGGDMVDAPAIAVERLQRSNADLRGVVREVHARPRPKRRWWSIRRSRVAG